LTKGKGGPTHHRGEEKCIFYGKAEKKGSLIDQQRKKPPKKKRVQEFRGKKNTTRESREGRKNSSFWAGERGFSSETVPRRECVWGQLAWRERADGRLR